MTATPSPARRPRAVRAVAVGAALSVAATGVALAGAGPAAAATTPYAQSVGRFLDGSAGGQPIQSIADLKDARATAPGSTSQQNPLDATLLGQAEVPIGHALQLPGGGAFTLGAVNQVAKAHNNGAAFGASGAVSNSGGISSGGNNNAYPANAKMKLSDKSLGSASVPGIPGLSAPPLPGVPSLPPLPGGSFPSLGGVSADIGAISAIARTEAGGTFATPRYKIASLALALKSPALAGLLKQLVNGGKQLNPVIRRLETLLGNLPGGYTLPGSCQPSTTSLPATIKLDHGAVVIDPSNGSITVNLGALLRTLGVKLNSLPPNTDLLAYVLNNLGRILSHGLANVVNGIINPIKALGQNCVNDITKQFPAGVGTLLQGLLDQLTAGQKQLETALEGIAAQLSSAGAPGLKQLTDNLAKVIAIGVNVQQGSFPLPTEASPKYKFTSALVSTPDQATATVPGQGVVRALEIDIAGSQGAALALGNAAAGPSSSPTAPPSSTPPTGSVPSTQIPTGVPAGAAADNGGSSALPLIVLLVVLTVGGGGAVAFRSRGRFTR